MELNKQFIEAINIGDLNSIIEIYRLNPTIDISAHNEQAFRYACKKGHLEIVRQLYEWRPTIDISAQDEYAFILACYGGHLEVVRQLYEWKPTIDISASGEYAFRYACQNGYLEVVRQLYEWKPTIDLSKYIQYRPLFISIGITFPSPLTKELIHEGETLECPICRDTILIECLVTKCNHKYCGKCINQWLEKNSACPYCRTLI